jgi:site-specific recombinase XerD
MSASSWRSYKSAFNVFQNFRSSYGLTSHWPAEQQHIVLFVSYCFEKGLSPKTIRTYISGLNYMHKMKGWYDIYSIFMIKKLLEGCSRTRKTMDTRAPITYNLLVIIVRQLHKVCNSAYESTLFSALFVLAYYGLFRVSELVSTNINSNQIQISDVTILHDKPAIIISLRKTKTNQRGSPIVIRIPRERDMTLCPWISLSEYMAIRPKIVGPAFCHVNGQPVTRYQFAAVLSRCLVSGQIDNFNIKTHSFRIGRATDLAARGAQSSAIMQMGRWVSNSFQTYVR